MALQTEAVLSDKEFRMISELVYKHCGINLHEKKKELVRARIAKRLREDKFDTFAQYIDHVMADKTGREFDVLIDSLSTNLTSFFREISHFEFLNKKFLPDLMVARQKKGKPGIRAWSAGCSSGEEPYTLAITLLEATEGLRGWDLKILATDISTQVLEKAKQGVYQQARVAPLSPQQKKRFLTRTREEAGKEPTYAVSSELKKIIRFRYLNLMERFPFKGPFDFIFCRNVMIYFDKKTQENLVNRYWDCLASGGVLFTGHSESLTGIQHKFKYIQPTIYARP